MNPHAAAPCAVRRSLVLSAALLGAAAAAAAAPASRLHIGAPPACASLDAPYLLSADKTLSPSLGTTAAPLFSWAVPLSQAAVAAVRVQVFSLSGGVAWDSGGVAIGAATGATPWSLAYNGSELAPGAPFSWRAATLAAGPAGAWSAWSANASGATALAAFAATPIWAAAATPAAPQFVLLRSVLALPPGARVAAALAFATAQPQRSAGDGENGKLLGAYKLWIGGALVGAGPGRPGRCGPALPPGADCAPEHVFDTYNVTAAVAAASAAGGGVALALACFAAPGVDAPRVLLELAVHLSDGAVVRAGTGAGGGGSWTALDATPWLNPGCCAEKQWFYQPQENIDARAEPVGWRDAAFAPPAPWPPAAPAPPFAAPLVPRRTRALALTEGLAPAGERTLPDGSIVYTFDREFQGGLALDFPEGTPAGGAWVVRMGEELRPDGSVLATMRTANNYTSIVTTRAGAQRVEQHEYSEFRYAQVSPAGAPPLGGTCAASAPADYTTPLEIACGEGQTIAAFSFISFGAPSGECLPGGGNNFAVNASCAAAGAGAVVRAACVGRAACAIVPSDATLNGGADPCDKTPKRLAAAWACAGPTPPPPPPSGPPPAVSAWAVSYPASFIADAAAACPGGAAGTGASGGSAASAAFASSSPGLDTLFEFCEWTVRATNLDLVTDSNTRQRSPVCAEAALATNGDIAAAAYEWGSQDFLNEYMINMSPPPKGAGWAEWQALLIDGVHRSWMASGDAGVARRAAPRLAAYLERELFNSTTGLWTADAAGSWSSHQPEVDWPPAMRDGFVFVPANTVVNAHYVGALGAWAALADAAGDAAGAAAARRNATALAAAVRARLWNATAGAFSDGDGARHAAVHSTAFALARGVADGDDAVGAAAWATLLARLDPAAGIPVGPYPGLFFGEALFRNSSDHGRAGVGRFLLNNGTSSWFGQLRAGATTTMESWTVAEKANLTWSHPWMAFLLQLVVRWVLGVRELEPGASRVLLQPQPGPLTSVAGAAPTPRGPVALSVLQALDGDLLPVAFAMNATVPGAVSARACLPAGACVGGDVRVDGRRVAGEGDGDYYCVEVGAGVHAFACPA